MSSFLSWLDENDLKRFEGVFNNNSTFETIESQMFEQDAEDEFKMRLIQAPSEKILEYSIIDAGCLVI